MSNTSSIIFCNSVVWCCVQISYGNEIKLQVIAQIDITYTCLQVCFVGYISNRFYVLNEYQQRVNYSLTAEIPELNIFIISGILLLSYQSNELPHKLRILVYKNVIVISSNAYLYTAIFLMVVNLTFNSLSDKSTHFKSWFFSLKAHLRMHDCCSMLH